MEEELVEVLSHFQIEFEKRLQKGLGHMIKNNAVGVDLGGGIAK